MVLNPRPPDEPFHQGPGQRDWAPLKNCSPKIMLGGSDGRSLPHSSLRAGGKRQAFACLGQVTEELAALKSIKGTTTGEDIYEKVCQTVNDLELDWAKLASVTTDGAPSMVGSMT
ncbi:hypothetical protein NDU88_002890 [Pleurodeles waltl]|uniref:DUF4371 domain-containing protein n=1 Tax=Pleurodeles waltl TaxID=8319 RepID=A0AAV7RES1_PLEWA|nr:hypothetical protein NDU88_002890 [Pleurodeles waltl]